MSNLTATAAWDEVPQLETNTPALGGPGGPMNMQAQALLNRTEALKTRVNFMDFVADPAVRASIRNGTCTTDLVASFAAWRAYLAASPRTRVGYLPPGVYTYSVSPNWAIENLTVISDGARMRYLGTGNALLFDATLPDAVGAVLPLCYAVHWLGRTYIEAPATASDAVFLRSVHHGRFESWNVRGAGTNFSGLAVQFSVCSHFVDYVCSGNEGGWYLGAKPKTGISLDKHVVGEDNGDASYCLFTNPVVEGTTFGVDLVNGLGNEFHAGTIEGCSDTAVMVSATSRQNKFNGTDFESNVAHDFLVDGIGNVISDCDTLTNITFRTGAYGNKIRGGEHVSIDMQAGSHHNQARDFVYDRLTDGGSVLDAGTYNSITGHRKPSSPYVGRTYSQQPVALTGSPMTVQNTTGDPQWFYPTGPIGAIYISHSGVGQIVPYVSGAEYRVEGGEVIVFVYTGTPVITAFR